LIFLEQKDEAWCVEFVYIVYLICFVDPIHRRQAARASSIELEPGIFIAHLCQYQRLDIEA